MTGGACGVLVAGVRVGTTEWERPARLKFRCLTGRAADALGGAGANGRSGRGGCRCAARVGVAAVPGAGVRGAAVPGVGRVGGVVDARLGWGLRGCWGRGGGGGRVRWGFGVERDLVGLG